MLENAFNVFCTFFVDGDVFILKGTSINDVTLIAQSSGTKLGFFW